MKSLFSILDLIFSKLPFTILSIPFIIMDRHAVVLLLIGFLLDIFIPGLFSIYQTFYAYKKLKNETRSDGFFTGEYESFNSELVNEFKRITFESALNRPKILGINSSLITRWGKDIKVVISDRIRTKFTTIPDLWNDPIIVIKKWFDDDDIKDVTKLAHEFGHVYHAFIRSEFYHKAFVALFCIIVVISCGVSCQVWWPLLISLPFCLTIFIRYSIMFGSYSESMSDIYACFIYEKLWGQESMVEAAKERIKDRLLDCRETKYVKDSGQNRLDRFTMYVTINYLARFVPVEYCNNLIELSKEYSSEYTENPELNEKERNSMLSIERLIRQALEWNKNINFDSCEYLLFNHTNHILLFCYLLSFTLTIVALLTIYNDYHFDWNTIPIWIVLMISIVIYLIYQIIIILLWNKKTKLMKKIGL